MFLFRGGGRTCQTNEENVESTNKAITAYRLNFDKDLEVLAKLCEGVLGPSSCSSNLHSLYHMTRKLIELKGHPTVETIVERVVRILFECPSATVVVAAASTFVAIVAAVATAVAGAAYSSCCCFHVDDGDALMLMPIVIDYDKEYCLPL